jgi:4,5-DOPA dioxygenase extradiol
MKTLPAIFVSHGSPMIALQPGETGAFLQRLGPAIDAYFGRPRAIVAVSAHTTARQPVVLAAQQHEAIYDFGNFDPELFTLRYDALGSPQVAERVTALLQEAGIPALSLPQGGLDHGNWTALRYLYPDANIPVVPLAFVPSQSPAAQFALGRALTPLLAEGVLIIGSGSITHNLQRVFAGGMHARPGTEEIPESKAFRSWFRERAQALDWDALFNYRHQAPHAADMHPTDEHLLPWYAAAGAGGKQDIPQRLHSAVTFGCLGMDAYAFGPGAQAIAEALL